jgi:hydroxypyruvate reductase
LTRFDPAVLDNDPERRRVMLDLLDHALDAVDPAAATAAALHRSGSSLHVGGEVVHIDEVRQVIVLGLGKAAPAMARAAVRILADLDPRGVVVAPEGSEPAPGLDLVAGDHPYPAQASLAAGARLLEAAAAAGPDDLVVAVVSGGGSALAEAPVAGATIDDIAAVTRSLVTAAVPIDQVNAVRSRLSRIKGGGLAAACGAARLITLVLSDVPGDPVHVVASGPTLVPPQSDAVAADVLEMLPATLRRAVEHHRDPPRHERHTWCIVADGGAAAAAVVSAAAAMGITARVAFEPLVGEARRVGRQLVADAPAAGLIAYAGETVVHVVGRGTGGRNQELALAAAIETEGDDGLVIAALATDGVDGPTTAAGAIIDGSTATRARERGFDPHAALDDNDSHSVLAASGDLLVTGPTGTNVADVVVVWRRQSPVTTYT